MKFRILIELDLTKPLTGPAKDHAPPQIAENFGAMFEEQFREASDEGMVAHVVESRYVEGT